MNCIYNTGSHLQPPELKSPKILFVHSFFICQIALNFCTCHTAVLCAQFQSDWKTRTDVMDNNYFRDFS